MQPRIAIIILCYNGLLDTLACIDSLAALDYPRDRLEIVVVDNASSDDTAKAVRAKDQHITVIETGANLGYAAGNNVGLRHASARGFDYILLLNNDTEVAPESLRLLVSTAESNPRIGIVGPTIYYHHTPTMIWSAGGTIDWRHGTSAMRGLNEIEHGQYLHPAEVDFVTGCALLCKSETLTQTGLLDERFFMYYEETEWCVRATRAGYRCVHVPHAHVWHKIRPERQAESPRIAYYMARNRLLFLRTAKVSPLVWLHALILQDLRACLSLSLRPRWRGQVAKRNALLRAWSDFCQGRFGALEQ